MPRFSPMQGDFSGGEFSPLMFGRTDTPRYKTGLARCENFIPTIQGPATRRAGTQYVAKAKPYYYQTPRLIPFKYSITQDYMLEFGDYYVRFYTQRGQIVVPANWQLTVSSGSWTTNSVFTDGTYNYVVREPVPHSAFPQPVYVYVTDSSGNPATPPSSGTLTFVSGSLATSGSFVYSAKTAVSVNVPYELSTPWGGNLSSGGSDISLIKYCQSLDVLYLVHPKFPSMTLNRFGNQNWTLSYFNFVDGPYLDVGKFPINRSNVLVAPPFATGFLVSSISVGAGTVGQSVTVTTQVGLTWSVTNVVNNGAGLCRVTISGAQNVFADGSQVYITGVTGATEANGTWIVKLISPNVYDLVGSTFTSAYVSGGGMYPAPFFSSDAGALPYGRLLRYGQFNNTNNTTIWAYLVITGYTNGSTVTGQILYQDPGFNTGSATQSSYFAFGVYNLTDGYPSCCTFHEDRLWLGAPGYSKVRIDGSSVSNYNNFAPSLTNDGVVTAANAVSFSLNSHDQNAIEWMRSDELGMPVGTQGGPWIIRPSILSEAISPTNISAKKVNTVSSASTDGVTAGKATIFLENSKRKMRELTYFYQIGGFRAINISEIAEHLPAEGITSELVYQSVPQQIIWCARGDGTLLSVTYDRELDALRTGWAKHYLGGKSDASGTPPLINSLGVIPSPDATTDDLWLIVTRLINGQTVQYVEYMTRIFQDFDEQENAFFVDCGAQTNVSPNTASQGGANPAKTIAGITNGSVTTVSCTGHGLNTGDKVKFYDVVGLSNSINLIPFTITKIDANTFTIPLNSTSLTSYTNGTGLFYKLLNSISGISWLEGETVNILGDGAVLTPQTVTSGVINLSTPSAVVCFGLPYTSKLQLLVLEGGSADGTSLGKNRRINEMSIMLNRSGAFFYGTSFDSDNLTSWSFRQPSDPMDEATPLFTGTQDRLQVEANYDLYNQLAIQVQEPTPFTLVAIMPQQTTYDKA